MGPCPHLLFHIPLTIALAAIIVCYLEACRAGGIWNGDAFYLRTSSWGRTSNTWSGHQNRKSESHFSQSRAWTKRSYARGGGWSDIGRKI